MKVIVRTKYGPPDVLKIIETEKPAPKDNEVLVKIHATALNAADWRVLRADPFLVRLMGEGFIKPKNKILGADVAGVVEATGKNIKQFKPGDEVFGDLAGYGWGGLAEYVAAPEKALAIKPENTGFNEAASLPMAAVTALQGLRDKGKIQPGMKVLINGASGGVGTFAVQIAKAFGAEVTAVCSTQKMEMVGSIGADHIIDYTKEDFTKSGKKYDLILAVNGYHPLPDYKRLLNSGGTYVMAGGKLSQMFQAILLGPVISLYGNRKITTVSAHANQMDLSILKEMVESGKIKPVIDRIYSLNSTAEAFRYIEQGHAIGKIIISIT